MFKKVLGLVLLLIFIGAGIGGMSSFAWLTGRKAQNKPAVPVVSTVLVLTAARDMGAGDLIKPDDVSRKNIQRSAFGAGGFILDDQNGRGGVIGAMLRHPLHAGDAIKSSDVLRTGDRGFLSMALAPGMRAVTISVDSTTGTPGLIWPGDYVDLILTRSSGAQQAVTVSSEIIISNARVLAIDRHLVHGADNSKESQSSQYGHTATLEVSPDDAERIYVASGLGKLSLVVRAARDGGMIAPARPMTEQDVSRLSSHPEPLPKSRTMRIYQGDSEKEVSY